MAIIRTVKKLLLGREIAHMIDTARISQTEAAKLIETSQSRINALIGGTGAIAPGDLMLLASKLGFTDEGYQEALREMRRDNHKRGFWSAGHNRAYDEEVRLLVDLEKHADQIRWSQVEVIPGLLQCEAYVRAMYADLPEIDGLTLDERVNARLARKDILDKSEAPSLRFVLSESCLRRMWGGRREVIRQQLDHMIKLSNRENVMIQVMPYESAPGRKSPIGNNFVLLHVPSPGQAGPLELAYVEGVAEIRYIDDKKALAAHDTAWARLSTAALNFAETRKFLAQVAREFKE
ncbi:DUF5753 domain-containing protein [Saccharopolyspora pogona]|uniref:DUF5753 domain-containing protein n=1 Tax=Saccharopolyspora pogona TaxID=333966 RepID=UPI001688E2F8|nr:DUF5753 domain-containing protein [Saccharopolyspora pogona]